MDNNELYWCMFFSGICSLRFHPKNYVKDVEGEVVYAAEVADLMLEAYFKRFPKE